MNYTTEMASGGTIYVPSFMITGPGNQVIYGYYLNNLRGYNVGITDL
jgi:hypothetical protein